MRTTYPLRNDAIDTRRLLMMGLVTGRVAHEINTPLGTIRNAAALLRHLGDDPSQRQLYTDLIEREVERIAVVVRQLHEAFDWGDASASRASLPDALEAGSAAVGMEGAVAVTWEVAADAKSVAVPENVLRLVLGIVLRAAIGSAPPGGTVRATARCEDGMVVLAVEDDGPGVPAAPMEALLQQGIASRAGARGPAWFPDLSFARDVLDIFDGSLTVDTAAAGGACLVTRWPLSHRPRSPR